MAFGRLLSYLRRAFVSAAYPLRGIYYFLKHPRFYPLFLRRLLPLGLLSIIVYGILFTFAFLPQLAFLAIFHGRHGAIFNAVVLVLGEGLVVIQGLFEGFFVDETRVDVFDVSYARPPLLFRSWNVAADMRRRLFWIMASTTSWGPIEFSFPTPRIRSKCSASRPRPPSTSRGA